MKIGICDDDMQELLHISSFLENYQKERYIKITYEVFKSGAELIYAASGGKYDILILDILMPGVTGLDVAKEIRTFDSTVKIIFLTSSPEFAVESYSVDAYHYLLKPTSAEKLFPILDKLVADARKPAESINVKTQSGFFRIPFFKLEFVEVQSKTLFFHLSDGSVKKAYGSLKEVEKELLSRDEFIKVHRAYIVNMQWIQVFGTREITTECNFQVPISRPLYTAVKETYMKYLYVEKGMK